MITQVRAGAFSLRGVSVGGVYTSIHVAELDAVLDVGVTQRASAVVGRYFISHGHLDHVGGLAGLLNARSLLGLAPATVFIPAAIEAQIRALLDAHAALSRTALDVTLVPMEHGDERDLGRGLFVRALRTYHPVASLAYQFFRKVQKLRAEHRDKPADEIARLRKAGATDLFERRNQLELAYVTDTLSRALDASPELLKSRVLVLECTFVDAARAVDEARRKAHIHVDELAAMADRFENDAVVLMHFSQALSPAATREALAARLPEALRARVVPFIPDGDRWFE